MKTIAAAQVLAVSAQAHAELISLDYKTAGDGHNVEPMKIGNIRFVK